MGELVQFKAKRGICTNLAATCGCKDCPLREPGAPSFTSMSWTDEHGQIQVRQFYVTSTSNCVHYFAKMGRARF